MTDGEDTGSAHPRSDVFELLDERPAATVFVVAVPRTSMREPKELPSLDEFSSRTNGKTFIAPGWHLEDVFLQRTGETLS